MFASGINNPDLDISRFLFSGRERSPTLETGDFSSTLQLRLAEIKSQTFGMLLSSAAGNEKSRSQGGQGGNWDYFDSMFSEQLQQTGLSASGRNTALFDPESAYRMMTEINSRDVSYKAEYVEMHDMKSHLESLQAEAQKLGGISADASPEEIQAHLQQFAAAYNVWIDRFDDEMKPGGLLAGTQAAHVSQWELEQSIENIFHGIRSGMHGMPDLGFTTDAVTDMAQLDSARLHEVLAQDRNAVIATLQEFGANFSRSAELLNSAGNFIPNRLDNLDRAIGFIDSNKASLQAEFGLGDVPKPAGKIAQGLASYNSIFAMAAMAG